MAQHHNKASCGLKIAWPTDTSFDSRAWKPREDKVKLKLNTPK